MASDEIDLTHFDEDPTLQSLIQECLLAFSEAQARMENSFELQLLYIFDNILNNSPVLFKYNSEDIYLWPLPFVKHHEELLYKC